MEPVVDQEVPVPGPATTLMSVRTREFPWWLVVVGIAISFMGFLVLINDEYREAFRFIIPGIRLTVFITVTSFIIATVLGLFIGLGRLSNNALIRNAATTYIELVRGIPVIVFIFLVAFVFTTDLVDLVNTAGIDLKTRSIQPLWRGIAALSLFYAAFIAEVFRAGIQSVDAGQLEAGRAMGFSRRQNLRLIILPQAIRNMLPALGNDLIAIFKDTSLLSILAVREVTQLARLYTGSTFRFREGFFILTVFYVSLTIALSLLLRWYEKRIAIPGRLEKS